MTLIVAAGLLIATSPPLRPRGIASHATVIPAGQQSAAATVDVDLGHEGLAEVAQPFDADLDVSSASLPAVDGGPAPAASVVTSVSADGSTAQPDQIPPAGTCDAEGCGAQYMVQFRLAQPAETDVVVSWELVVAGPEDADSESPVHVSVDGDVADDDIGAQRLKDGSIEVRLDRIADADARIDIVNGGQRAVVVDVDGSRTSVPAGASVRVPVFAGCDQPACTVHARFDHPLDGGVVVIDGPVIATAITERATALVDAPAIRSEPVTRIATLTADAPRRGLQITADADQALSRDWEGESNNVQAAVHVRMQLNAWDDHDTAVRYRPNDGTEPIVLSAAGAEGEEITLASDPRDPPADYWGELELLSGERAEVEIMADAIAAYPNGVPNGAEATTTITVHDTER